MCVICFTEEKRRRLRAKFARSVVKSDHHREGDGRFQTIGSVAGEIVRRLR